MASALQSALPFWQIQNPSHAPLQTGPLLRSVEAARREAHRLLAYDRISEVTDRIANMAIGRGHRYVYGSSVFGHMLVGAMVSRWCQLVVWTPGTDVDLLLVDGPVAGTAELIHRAEIAKLMGARSVDALTVGSVTSLEAANSGIDNLWVLGVDSTIHTVEAD